MKKALLLAAATLLMTAPAFAQKVSIGTVDIKSQDKDAVFLNAEYSKEVWNGVEGVVEGRFVSSNQHFMKVGAQKELVTNGVLTLNGRVNLTQNFGKTSATGWSVEPTGTFMVDKATVTLGYEFGDTFKSNLRDRIRTATVEVMYPFEAGDFGLRYENAVGDRRETAVSLVYSFKN
jgi:hypothetical protein